MTSPAELLNQVHAYAGRFIAYPDEHSATAHTLWMAHAHVVTAFDNTPRITFLSPEPGSGKSRAMEITEHLVPRSVLSVNSSVAYIFRKISDEEGLPTLLMDEVDAIFGKGRNDNNEDLRGLLNSGYRKGAIAGRAAMRGKEVITEDWPSFCAVAMAGLNQLPDTLMTRSIVIPMKRRKPNQRVEPFRRRVNGPEADQLMLKLSEWMQSIYHNLQDSWPELPAEVEDRDADLWEPIIAVADAAGGQWPHLARQAAVAMVAKSKETPLTLGVQLLTDIQKVFTLLDADRISTNDLLDALHDMPEAPWSNLRGEPIDARFIGKELRRYEISSETVRFGEITQKGFLLSRFMDAFERYVPVQIEEEDEQLPDHPFIPLSHGNKGNNGNGIDQIALGVTDVTDVTATREQAEGATLAEDIDPDAINPAISVPEVAPPMRRVSAPLTGGRGGVLQNLAPQEAHKQAKHQKPVWNQTCHSDAQITAETTQSQPATHAYNSPRKQHDQTCPHTQWTPHTPCSKTLVEKRLT